jgi:hypothetical protein
MGHGLSARLQVQDLAEAVSNSSRRHPDARWAFPAVNLPTKCVNRDAAQARSFLFGNDSLSVDPARLAGCLTFWRRVSVHGALSGKNAQRRVNTQKDAPNPTGCLFGIGGNWWELNLSYLRGIVRK